MSTPPQLFELPEPYRADPVARRRTWVAGHPRTLPPGATPHQAPTPEPKVERLVDTPETHGRARATDPQTSVDAAKLPGKVALKWRYLVGLVDGGPQTDFEVAARIGSQQTACGPRRPSLMEAGYVEATGERRAAPSGATAAVWRATPAGIEKARELRMP